MKWRSPRLWIGVLSAAVVLYVVVDALDRTSPGPLATVHGRVAKLAGGAGCAECHGGWFESMTDACLACHEDVAAHIESGAGLHGALGAVRANQCAVCHSDHHGPDFAIVNRQSFAQAGVPDPAAFDHAFVGFPMDGTHLELDCGECHEHVEADPLPEGARRYLGLDRDCATCHEDVHEGKMVLACAKCHGQTAFDEFASLGHDEFLPLIGGHADVSCRTCHAENTAHALEALGGRTPAAARECVDCHESPHAATFTAGVARLTGQTPGDGCDACHLPEHTSFVAEGLTVTAAQHAASGFALDLPHDDVACADCHTAAAGTFAARYPGRAADDCAACHEDVHRGQFGAGPFAAAGCVACHERTHFDPHTFTVETHARTSMPLTGRHVETACAQCHVVPAPDAARVFRGTQGTCEACHADAHAGFFDRFLGDLAVPESGECALCHGTEGFSPVRADRFDHARWTGFPLRGAHAQETCEACHARTEEPDAAGRSFGTVAATFGAYAGCATCHADPHEGGFDKPHLPATVRDRAGCARCHGEASFRVLAEPFDHGKWTGFPLLGAHGATDCTSCHAPLRRPTAAGRTWAHAKGSSCADCHDDPHRGQFERAGATDCARCHKSADSFTEISFNHNLDARFRLGDAHEGLACDACHATVKEDGAPFVRYRPLGRRCVDCHGQQEDPLRRRKGRNR